MTSLTLTAAGSGVDNTGIEVVWVWMDANENGVADGGDNLLGSAVYTGDDGTAVLALDSVVPAFSDISLLVVYDFYPTAPEGGYQAGMNTGGLSGTSAYGPLQFTGLPLTGAVITIAHPTATPTPSFTPTASMTPTASLTATPSASPTVTLSPTGTLPATATHTPLPTDTPTVTPSPSAIATDTFTNTPLPSEVVISCPYPNPCREGQPVNVDLRIPGPYTLKWAVFTVAFRKINSGEVSLTGSGTFQWDLKDKTGVPAASGLYYLRIEVNSDLGTVAKVFKILILK